MAVGAIVLAAGASTRMGQQKLLLPFAGTTVVAHIVRELRATHVAGVHVVVGFEPHRVREALSGTRVNIVENPDYTRGMLSSIRTGLASAPAEWTAALIALGDQPLIRGCHAVDLMRKHEIDPQGIFVPGHEGRRGHPLLLPRRFWNDAVTRYDDTGLRGLLQEHAKDVHVVEMGSEDVLTDMDTLDEYRQTLTRAESRRPVS